MNRSWFLLAAAMVYALVAVGASCSDGDDDNNDGGATWTDAESGLEWQDDSLPTMNWPDAVAYCEDLEFGGDSDWRLPSIGELRTLVRGCDATATGGLCEVTDECLEQSCENDICLGCENNNGPGVGGEYWPAELADNSTMAWSSSTVADNVGNAFVLIYSYAGITNAFVKDSNELTVRCVR